MFKELEDENKLVFVKEDKTNDKQVANSLFDIIKENNYKVAKKTLIKTSHPDVGLGIFADEDIEEGEVIEVAYLVPLAWRSNYQRDPQINKYVITNSACKCKECRDHGSQLYFMTGNGMIYNHSDNQNVKIDYDFKRLVATYTALRKIEKNEELFTNYGPNYFKNNPALDIKNLNYEK
jgi:hypothetical protein